MNPVSARFLAEAASHLKSSTYVLTRVETGREPLLPVVRLGTLQLLPNLPPGWFDNHPSRKSSEFCLNR
jgi:hypothetical protein